MSKLSEKLEYEKNVKNTSYRELSRITGINDVQIGRIFKQKMDNVIPQYLKKISKALDINYNELMYVANYSSYINSSNKFLIKYYINLPLEEKMDHKKFLDDSIIFNNKILLSLKSKLLKETNLSLENQDMLENIISDYEYTITQSKNFSDLLSKFI
jgi:DNA-binding Xre family transcriptional regulator